MFHTPLAQWSEHLTEFILEVCRWFESNPGYIRLNMIIQPFLLHFINLFWYDK